MTVGIQCPRVFIYIFTHTKMSYYSENIVQFQLIGNKKCFENPEQGFHQ